MVPIWYNLFFNFVLENKNKKGTIFPLYSISNSTIVVNYKHKLVRENPCLGGLEHTTNSRLTGQPNSSLLGS